MTDLTNVVFLPIRYRGALIMQGLDDGMVDVFWRQADGDLQWVAKMGCDQMAKEMTTEMARRYGCGVVYQPWRAA